MCLSIHGNDKWLCLMGKIRHNFQKRSVKSSRKRQQLLQTLTYILWRFLSRGVPNAPNLKWKIVVSYLIVF